MKDVVLLSAATHKLSRTLTKDAVTSPLRAPFTRYADSGGPAEVMEVASTFTAFAGADFLQLAYAAAQQAPE